MTSSAKGDADYTTLAAQVVAGPVLFAPDDARQRLAGWLADLPPAQAAAVKALAEQFPKVRTILEGIAEASPYLFDLMRADGARLERLLRCHPDTHMRKL